MKIDEAKNTNCPLDSHPEERYPCEGQRCAWWIPTDPDEGECAVVLIAKGATREQVLYLPHDKPELIR